MTKTHGDKGKRIYNIWKRMRQRCNDPHDKSYPRYGGSGIKVCREWQADYVPFRDWAYAHGYSDSLTIDRIANSKGYTPDNCRWATRHEQKMNQSVSLHLTAFGETKTTFEWLSDPRCHAPNRRTFANRLHRGWPIEKAITTPRVLLTDKRPYMTAEWCALHRAKKSK